jgi:hypothetical protein
MKDDANHWGLLKVCIQLASKALRPFRRTSEEGANATDDASLGKPMAFEASWMHTALPPTVHGRNATSTQQLSGRLLT